MMTAIPEPVARTVLRILSRRTAPDALDEGGARALERWLVARDLGPQAYARLHQRFPDLGRRLQPDAFSAMAENALLRRLMVEYLEVLQQLGIPAMALKGFAAASYFGGYDWRTMSDIDLLVPRRMMETLQPAVDAGLYPVAASKKVQSDQTWPISVHGSIGFIKPIFQGAQLDIHSIPFPGFWQRYFARFGHSDMWSRRAVLPLPEPVKLYRPEINDLLLHTAAHIAVNHQFNDQSLRSLMDVALLAQMEAVDWEVVVSRARTWRIATVVWLVMDLVQQLFGLEEAAEAARVLAPSPLRRRSLRAFIPWRTLLNSGAAGAWRRTPLRFLFLALLVDRG